MGVRVRLAPPCNQGEIVERGTHAQLLEAGGEYANLWLRQQEAMATGNKSAEGAAPPVAVKGQAS